MSESKFSQVTREGIERNITEAYEAGDINLTNEQLDIYPTGHPRPEIVMDISHLLKRDREADLEMFRKAA